MRILYIIPARKGSKGLPGKHTKILGAKSLIEYSIHFALENIKDDSIKQTTKLLKMKDLWLKEKEISEFEHNKINAKKFLEEWETAFKESDIPMIN